MKSGGEVVLSRLSYEMDSADSTNSLIRPSDPTGKSINIFHLTIKNLRCIVYPLKRYYDTI